VSLLNAEEKARLIKVPNSMLGLTAHLTDKNRQLSILDLDSFKNKLIPHMHESQLYRFDRKPRKNKTENTSVPFVSSKSL